MKSSQLTVNLPLTIDKNQLNLKKLIICACFKFSGPLFDPKGLLVSKKVLGLHYFDLLIPHLDTPEKACTVIGITCPCDLYPLAPHFYIVKAGFTGVFIMPPTLKKWGAYCFRLVHLFVRPSVEKKC